MNTRPSSPKIVSIAWGKMEIERLGPGKDFKLWPGGGRPWDWQETGTGHSPGIQVADVRELIEHGCQTIILSKGRLLRLKVPKETIVFLETQGITPIVAETKKAVKIYNQYVEIGASVGGLFHSTC